MRLPLLLLGFVLSAGCAGDHVISYGVERDDDDDDSDDEGGGGWDLGDDTGATDDGGDSEDGGSTDDGGLPQATQVEPGELVVTELMIDASAVSDEHGEWVELYNDSDRKLSLSGLVLGDDGVDAWVLEGTVDVGAGDFVVLCADSSTASNGGVSCDGSFHYNTWGEGFALSNGGDEVVLARQDGTIIDEMAYSEGQVVPGAALGLAPSRTDAGDNDSAGAWCTQSSALSGGDSGTPGRANDAC